MRKFVIFVCIVLVSMSSHGQAFDDNQVKIACFFVVDFVCFSTNLTFIYYRIIYESSSKTVRSKETLKLVFNLITFYA